MPGIFYIGWCRWGVTECTRDGLANATRPNPEHAKSKEMTGTKPTIKPAFRDPRMAVA
jgi:hypothetical protein